ncbi:uncharacterized protein LOC142616359 [Castanea sativa]|uniref:uncharacterized protein LOC142616359 n=1 Tax=Castanea sativa TaxID=21020 RepID=UPI003F64F4E4
MPIPPCPVTPAVTRAPSSEVADKKRKRGQSSKNVIEIEEGESLDPSAKDTRAGKALSKKAAPTGSSKDPSSESTRKASAWRPNFTLSSGNPVLDDANLRDPKKGSSSLVAECLEKALCLPEDMAELRSFCKREVFPSLKQDLAKAVQASFMAEEWVDHSLDLARKAEHNAEAAVRAQKEAELNLKETLTHLSEVEKAQKNAKAALQSYESQAKLALEAQKQAQSRLALTVVELKQVQGLLATKEQEQATAEQVAYDAGMKKVSDSLTAQLKGVARAFCLEVWGHALDAAGVAADEELRAPDSVYYPAALRLAPTPLMPPSEPAVPIPAPDPSDAPTTKNPSPTAQPVEEVIEGDLVEEPTKKKKKDKEPEKRKDKQPVA